MSSENIVNHFHQPIETSIGKISGRNAIYLNEVFVDINENTLSLQGFLNGRLCSIRQPNDIDFELIFERVRAFSVIELDSWHGPIASCFDEVLNSDWIKELKGKVTEKHKHFFVLTYDDVFNVVCENYKLLL